MENTYYVMCRVSGGYTGTREALLKSSGVVRTFATREEAATEARRLMSTPRLHETAHFQYWPVGPEDR